MILQPLMTFEVILHFMKTLRLYNVSIHISFHQNWFINECAVRKKLKSFFLLDIKELNSFCDLYFKRSNLCKLYKNCCLITQKRVTPSAYT